MRTASFAPTVCDDAAAAIFRDSVRPSPAAIDAFKKSLREVCFMVPSEIGVADNGACI